MEHLKDILARFIDSSGLARQTQYGELQQAWAAMLGDAAAHTRLESVRKNVATFVVDSAALLAELNNFRKLELLERLQAEVRSMFIGDLKFRLGTLQARGK